MTTATEPRVLQTLDGAPWDIEAYRKIGGYEAWKKCIKELSANDIVNELKKAGLRGRGGAGFPTGIKWEKVLNHRVKEQRCSNPCKGVRRCRDRSRLSTRRTSASTGSRRWSTMSKPCATFRGSS